MDKRDFWTRWNAIERPVKVTYSLMGNWDLAYHYGEFTTIEGAERYIKTMQAFHGSRFAVVSTEGFIRN